MRIGILLSLDERIAQSVKTAARLGFSSGQVSVWDMSLYTAECAGALKRTCEDAGFAITAIWAGWSGPVDWSYPGMYATLGLAPAWLRAQRMNDLLKGAEFARMLGVRDVVTHIGFIPDNPLDEGYLAVSGALKVIGGELKKHGQRFLFETGEELPVTLVQMMLSTGCENLGVNFDPANLLINGRGNPTDALRLFAPFLMGMHAKDATGPSGTSPKGHETPIGKGHVDFPALAAILRESGYGGDVTIERETAMGEAWEKDVSEAKAYLEGLLRE